MSVYVGHIQAGVVVQVTVEPDGYVAEPGQAIIGPQNTVGIGWTYSGGTFTPPVPVPE